MELKFRAIITWHPVPTIIETVPIYFTLQELVTTNQRFSTRELIIPWLRMGNIPDLYVAKDCRKKDIYTGDIIRWKSNENSDYIAGIVLWSSERGAYLRQISKGKVRFKNENGPPDEFFEKFYSYDGDEFSWNELEITSNVYKSPKLLEIKEIGED